MKRKINRVKKEYQVYMHKVHILCWLGHGNYVSKVLNDQEVLAAALLLVPSEKCYPSERVDIKYLEQITTWYKNKWTIKLDKNENKFRPKAPSLKELLLTQMKSRTITTYKYLVFIFISMLRALGLQCRIVFNFVTVPLKPPTSELCSLSTKNNESKSDNNKSIQEKKKTKASNVRKRNSTISQIDGCADTSFCSDSDFDNIMQLDGNNDNKIKRTTKSSKIKSSNDNQAVSPPKKARTIKEKNEISDEKNINVDVTLVPKKVTKSLKSKTSNDDQAVSPPKKARIAKEKNESVEKQINADVTLIPKKIMTRRQMLSENITNVSSYFMKNDNLDQSESKNTEGSNTETAELKDESIDNKSKKTSTSNNTRGKNISNTKRNLSTTKNNAKIEQNIPPKIIVTDDKNTHTSHVSTSSNKTQVKKLNLSRNPTPSTSKDYEDTKIIPPAENKTKRRTKSAPNKSEESSKYFEKANNSNNTISEHFPSRLRRGRQNADTTDPEDEMRVCHRVLKRALNAVKSE